MELGAGITAGSAIIGSAAVAIKIINAIVATRNGNGKHCEKYHCSDHEGVVVKVDGIEKWLTRIDNKIDRLLERRTETRN
jgi:hypothetical protein